MAFYQSNYPSNSGPPPPPNPFAARAYPGGMAGGAYNNYGGSSAYNVNQYPGMGGGYQQQAYGGEAPVPGAPYGPPGAHTGAPPPGAQFGAPHPGAQFGAPPHHGAHSGAPSPGAQFGAPHPGAQFGASYPGAQFGAPPHPGAQFGASYPGAQFGAPPPGAHLGAPHQGSPFSTPAMGGGAVPGFTVPYQGPQAGQAPPCQAPPPSMQYQQMQNQMANMGMMQMQRRMYGQLGVVSDDEEDFEEEKRRRKRDRRRKRLEAEEEEEAEDDLEQERNEERRIMEERAQKAEEKAQKLQEKLENNEELKQELRSKFIAELMRRQEVSGTFEETQGTVFPYMMYEETDPVTVWFKTKRKDGSMDIAGEKWENGEYDAEFLRFGMRGAGTNEKMIIDVVSSRCGSQRYTIKLDYKTAYGRDLVTDLKSELSGDFKDSILACFESPARYDAWCVKKAIYGAGTDERALIEILMTRTNAQIQEMAKEYNMITYGKMDGRQSSLEKDIREDTSGDFKRLCISASQGNRRLIAHEKLEDAVEEVHHNGQWSGMFQINFQKLVNMSRCKQYAEELYKAGEKKIGTDEETFNRIFATQDYYTLRIVWDEYVKLSQRDILNSIERETSRDLKHGLLAIAQNIKCRPMFFAERLYKSMKGLGTDDTTLIRIVISRSEIDMIQIKQCFLEKYKQTLWNFIKDDTSGDYRKILLGIVGRD